MKIAARASLVVAGVIASLAGSARYTHYSADYNVEKTVHTGSSTATYLLLPVIPKR